MVCAYLRTSRTWPLLAILFLLSALWSTSYAATGALEVYSQPSGAAVYIDGIRVGMTPYQNVEMPLGQHTVKAVLSKDYPEQSRTINVDRINPVVVRFNFDGGGAGKFSGTEIEQTTEKFKGSVQFLSVPTGATVFINSEQKRKTPIGFQDVPVGRYAVEFDLNGKRLRGSFGIIKDETTKLLADFNKMRIVDKGKEEQEIHKQEEERRRVEAERQRAAAAAIQKQEEERRRVEAERQRAAAEAERRNSPAGWIIGSWERAKSPFVYTYEPDGTTVVRRSGPCPYDVLCLPPCINTYRFVSRDEIELRTRDCHSDDREGATDKVTAFRVNFNGPDNFYIMDGTYKIEYSRRGLRN